MGVHGSLEFADVRAVEGFGVTFVLVVVYAAEDTRVSEIVDGELKNELTSKVSRKAV